MRHTLRKRATIQTDGKLEIVDPELEAGDCVDVLISPAGTPAARSAWQIISDGTTKRVFGSAREVDHHLAPAWQRASAGQFSIVCSELVLAEALVQPIRQENRYLEETARLRAAAGLKTPDALHATTAQQVACASFVTNDSDFRRVQGLPVVILDDLL